MADPAPTELGWPPGPRGSRRSGNLRDIREDRLGFFRRCAELGDFVPFRVGKRQVVFLNHPDLIEVVVSKRAGDYSKNYLSDFFHPILKKQLLLSETDSWLEQRRLAHPVLRPDRLTGYADTMAAFTARMCDRWEDGRRLDIDAQMRRLTLEILAQTVFDVDVTREAAEAGDIVDAILDDVATRAGGRAYVPFVLPTPANLRLLRTLRRLDALMNELIDERRANAEGRDDLLSRLVADLQRSNDDVKLTAIPLFFAGHETTAMTLTWTLYLLSHHPEVTARMLAEVDAVLGDRLPAMGDVRALRYIGCVVLEALRLYPPIWGFGRQAMRDTEIGPYRIPEGTTVFMSQWVLHRDRRWFEDPDAFRPERWEDGLERRLPRCVYVPFGAGPRRCLGNNFAVIEAVIALSIMCRRFRFDMVDPGHPEMEPLITLRPKRRIAMTLHARERTTAPAG
jgi:cytochrome P450